MTRRFPAWGHRASSSGRGHHMSATLAVRHTVSDYAAWRKVYD